MDKHVEHIVKFLKSLSVRQRVLLGASAAAVVLTLLVFVKLFSAPAMSPLFTGLSATDSQAMAQRLAARGVSYQVSSDGGTILVPADQLDKLRMQMSTLGPPATGRMGWKLFDKPNWSGSDFSEKVDYQRALEGELEETIDTISEVEESRVHLVLPHDSLFTDEQREGKAAVVLRLRGRLSNGAIVGIERLVSGAVDDLPPKNVTIIDADTGAPLVPRESDGTGIDAPQIEAALERKIVDTLGPVVGAGHVRASVTVERDPSSAESTQEVYDPSNPVVLTSQMTQQTSATNVTQGVPGTSSNVPKAGSKPPAAQQAKTETTPEGTLSESKTYAVSKTVSHTVEPAGRIERIDAAVIVDDATETKTVNGHAEAVRVKRTPAEMQQLDALTKAAIGFDAKRGDQVVVQNLSFVALPAPKAAPVPLPERVLRVTNQWMSVVRLAGLFLLFALVYFIVLRPLKKQLLASFRQMPQPAAATAGAATAGGAERNAATGPMAEATDEEVVLFESELEGANSEVKRVVMLKRNLVEKVKSEPAGSTRLLENWIRQGKAAS
jgi:flagellar M-ring protein FliF